MRLFKFIILVLFIGLPQQVWAQKNKSVSKFAQTPTQLLSQAQELRQNNPQEAIKLCQSVLEQKSSKANNDQIAQAYILLGDIFGDIGQNELALERYNQALDLLPGKQNSDTKALVHYQIGRTQYRLNNSNEASNNFQLCISNTEENQMELKCQEGIADVAFQQQNYSDGIQIYDKLLSYPQLDSLDMSRIAAKKTIYYSQQNDLSNAQFSYTQSLNTLPNKEISKEELNTIRAAGNSYITNFKAVPKEELLLNEVSANRNIPIPEDNLIEENLDLADVAIDKDQPEEALALLETAKGYFSPNSAPEIKAKVFKKSSDIFLDQGDYQNAIANYREYAVANDQLLLEKQAVLDKEIAIIKGQQAIDLQVKDASIAEKDAAIMATQLANQRILIISLACLLGLALTAFYFIWKNIKRRQRASRMLMLRSKRNQMNPHFIFNALNSINNYIAQNDERAANKFLGDFSKLMRLVLENSKRDFISMADEIQLLELYLKLEHLRFRDKFDYTIEKSSEINYQEIDIPPMLIQPFVENAVWHGLRYKKDMGALALEIKKEDQQVKIVVRDDGIGRQKSKELKTSNQQKFKSTGLENTFKRIELINQVYDKAYQIDIKDLHPESEEKGTEVTITLPYSHD